VTAAAANGRAHLSIGEVLSLLQEEFPDVTISKIRFLESQGLLDPERTPSGYRKFYEYDIERLRWILRLQKDHYLPLKVIKDRLDEAGGAVPSSQGDNGSVPTTTPADAGRGRQRRLAEAEADASTGPRGRQVDRRERRDRRVTPDRRAGSSAGNQGQLPGVRRLDPAPSDEPTPPTPLRARTGSTGSGSGRPVASTTARNRAAAASDRSAGSPPRAAAGASRQRSQPSSAAAPGPSASSPSARRGGGREPDAAAASGRANGHPVFDPGSDAVSLTIDELAEASGLSLRDIRDLERFGLVEPREGSNTYDGDALIVARTAAGFLQHGIEARHMRTYKVAVDREAGLFQQIVSPVLKQRNPEARTRAARTVTELIRLGEVMRGVLLRRELRDQTGGS
jgi:DNA-binding transcriptional MerR regulator